MVSRNDTGTGVRVDRAQDWHPAKNGNTKPSDVLAAAKQRVWWRCPIWHPYAMAVVQRTPKGCGCPACAGL
jgi:hypothetical protein